MGRRRSADIRTGSGDFGGGLSVRSNLYRVGCARRLHNVIASKSARPAATSLFGGGGKPNNAPSLPAAMRPS